MNTCHGDNIKCKACVYSNNTLYLKLVKKKKVKKKKLQGSPSVERNVLETRSQLSVVVLHFCLMDCKVMEMTVKITCLKEVWMQKPNRENI